MRLTEINHTHKATLVNLGQLLKSLNDCTIEMVRKNKPKNLYFKNGRKFLKGISGTTSESRDIKATKIARAKYPKKN